MTGLLYKDFVSIKGKYVILLLLGLTVLFLVIRFLFPGNVETEVMGMVENEAGEFVNLTMGELADSLLVLIPLFLIACNLCLPSMWTIRICRNDEKNKTRQFIRVLPCESNAYIASKYIFIGIAIYVLFSLEHIWIIIFNSQAGLDSSIELMNAFSSCLPAFSGACLLLAAVELPFFITLGEKKGKVIKTAMLELLAFLVAAYMFFGNIKIFQNWDITALLNWCKKYSLFITVISMITPAITLLLYYLSYQLTCRLNQNREVEIDG